MKKLILPILVAILVGCGGGSDSNSSNGSNEPNKPTNPEKPQSTYDRVVKSALTSDGATSNTGHSIIVLAEYKNAKFNELQLYKDDSYALLIDDYKTNLSGVMSLINRNVNNEVSYVKNTIFDLEALFRQNGARVETLANRTIKGINGDTTYTIHDVSFTSNQKLHDLRQLLVGYIDRSVNPIYPKSFVKNGTKSTKFRLFTSQSVVDKNGFLIANITPINNYDESYAAYVDMHDGQSVAFNP